MKMLRKIHPVFFLLVDESLVVGGPSLAAPCFGLGFGAIVCCDPTRVVEDDEDGALEADGGALVGVGP